MIKDKFVLWTIIATIVIFVGAVLIITKMESTASAPNAPTAVSEDQKKLLELVSDDYIKGNIEASVTLVEYLDFECEACRAYYPMVKQLSSEFENDLRVVVRYFPLPGHKNSMNAALAVEAANRQGKYWQMHDILYENQQAWGEKQTSDARLFETYAQQIGLNMDQFKDDTSNKELRQRIERDKFAGQKLGVSGTPTFFLNGEKIPNPKSYDDFKSFIKAALLKVPKSITPDSEASSSDVSTK